MIENSKKYVFTFWNYIVWRCLECFSRSIVFNTSDKSNSSETLGIKFHRKTELQVEMIRDQMIPALHQEVWHLANLISLWCVDPTLDVLEPMLWGETNMFWVAVSIILDEHFDNMNAVYCVCTRCFLKSFCRLYFFESSTRNT